MSYITRNLKQTVLYWEKAASTGFGFNYSDAVEILGRWQDKQELFVDAQGRERRSIAVVYLNRDVNVGDYLYLGELEDLGDSSSALDISDPSAVESYEVKAFKKTPNLRATAWERKAWL